MLMRAILRFRVHTPIALMVCIQAIGCVSSSPEIANAPTSVRAQNSAPNASPYQGRLEYYQISEAKEATPAQRASVASSLTGEGTNEQLAPVVQKLLAADEQPNVPLPENDRSAAQANPGATAPRMDGNVSPSQGSPDAGAVRVNGNINLARADAGASAPRMDGDASRNGVGAVADGSLDLPYFVHLATENNPDVAAARTRIGSAKGKMLQAGLYPNPVIELRTDEAGLRQGPGGFLGVTFVQSYVRGGKLTLDKAAASQFVTASDWQSVIRWFFVLTQVRSAYVEKLTANREVTVSKEVVDIAEKGLDAAKKLREGGAGTEPDVLQAQVEVEQSRMRLEVAKQRSEAATRVLTAVIGLNGRSPFGDDPKPADRLPFSSDSPMQDILDDPPPDIDFNAFRDALLIESCEVKEATALAKQAEVLIHRAEAELTPDLLMQVRPQYSFADQQAAYTLIASSAIPVWNRNQGNIFAAKAEYAARLQDVRRVQNRLAERLALTQQRYLTARKQVDIFRKDILPRAAESLRLVRLGYERGDAKYDYVTVLNAQRTLAQAKLAQVQVLGEMWKALAEIAGLAQWETW